MSELRWYVEKERKQLEEVIFRAEAIIESAPDGKLRIAQKQNQYYWVENDTDKKGTYIRRSNEQLARQLAQKDYAIKIRNIALKNLKAIKRWDKSYAFDEIRKFYETLSQGRQQLITPFVLTDADYVDAWKAQHLEDGKRIEEEYIQEKQMKSTIMNGGYDGAVGRFPLNSETGIMTERGEFVRSKSEKILADKLYLMDVPYLYEELIYLPGYGYATPDFTVLNKRTRKEYYWEHFGMMDNPEYCNKAIKKIASYEKNHFYIGRKLLITRESSVQSLNMNQVEEFIKEFLL